VAADGPPRPPRRRVPRDKCLSRRGRVGLSAAGGRTSVVHQFAHVAATPPHAAEPGFCERPQIIGLGAQPGIDCGVACHRRREAKDVLQWCADSSIS
jgi:hypothetical protein